MSQAGWITVHFDEQEQEQIVQIGSSRRGAKEASGMSGEKLEAEYQDGCGGFVKAYAAECTIAKMLGVEPQTDISRSGNSGKHVSMDLNGRELWFNAAYVSDPTYDLKFTPDRIPDADVFMLTCGEPPEKMRIMGGVSAESFQKACSERDYGHGLRLAVDQSDLTPARTICSHLGLGNRLEYLDEADRKKRLQEKRKYGSLFGEQDQHRDPA